MERPLDSSHPDPPGELDAALDLDPADWPPRRTYHLLTGLVVPRPIAWVSTQSRSGDLNLAPHSYFNAVGYDPPTVMFASSGRKDTLTNVEATGEFVVNLVSRALLERMNTTAADLPPDEDEFAWAGVTPIAARVVSAPRVAEAPAALECRLTQVVEAGGGYVVLGEVVRVHVDPAVWSGGRIDPLALDPIGRLGGSRYTTLGEILELPRPSWADLRGGGPPLTG
jgi:flavin reductase (DIM6/NTAB) family NADH-FMN oxidoreductase RutF